jgi:hypothetical protein
MTLWRAVCELLREMECLIRVVQAGGLREVRVAGRLTEAQVPDLLRVCAENTGLARIDLGELMSADGVGREVLHRLRTSGVEIVNAPRFIELTLDTMSRGPGG